MIPAKPKNKIGKRRWNLWVHGVRTCYYCDRTLRWEETTLEHIYSRVLIPKRPQPGTVKGPYTVLACESCNQKQAEKEWQSMTRSQKWKRNRSFPKWTRKDLTIRERIFILYHKFFKFE